LAALGLDAVEEMNRIYQAKDDIAISRANALPRLNLPLPIDVGPDFELSAATALLPYVLPIKPSASAADKLASKISALNAYASGATMLATYGADLDVANLEKNRALELSKLLSNVNLNTVPKQDVANLEAQISLRKSNLADLNSLLATERDLFQELFFSQDSFSQGSLEIAPEHEAAIPEEKESISALSANILNHSPEMAELNTLIMQASEGVFEQDYAKIEGSNLVLSPTNNSDSDKMFNLGFANAPQVRISNEDVAELETQRAQFVQNSQILASALLQSLEFTRQQLEVEIKAVAALEGVYKRQVAEYIKGKADLVAVIESYTQVDQEKAAQIETRRKQDALRLTLERALLIGRFSPTSR
jgi:hypothetical protein